MIEAYEIGIKISAIDKLSSSLTGIISKLQQANSEVLKLSDSLRRLGSIKINPMQSGAPFVARQTSGITSNYYQTGRTQYAQNDNVAPPPSPTVDSMRRSWVAPSVQGYNIDGTPIRKRSGFSDTMYQAWGGAVGVGAKLGQNKFFRGAGRFAGKSLMLGMAAEYAAPLIAGYAAYETTKYSAEYQYTLRSIAAIRGANAAQMRQINNMLQATSSKYGFGLEANATEFHHLVAGSALTVNQLQSIYPALLKGADAYRLMHPHQNPMAFIQMAMRVAHSTGNYSPKNIRAIRNAVLGYSATTDVSSGQSMSALTYSIKPGIMALGDTPQGLHQYFALMSTFSRQGNLRSLGGRNFADFFINTMRPTTKAQMGAMAALGLWGPGGSTVVNAQGQLNLQKMMAILHADKSKYLPNQLTNLEYTAYGKQAGLIVNTMTSKNFNQQYSQAYAAQNLQGLNKTISQNTNTLMGQFQIFEGNMSRLMEGMGHVFTPALIGLMKYGINPATKLLADAAQSHPINRAKRNMLNQALAIRKENVFDAMFGTAGFSPTIHTHVHIDGKKVAEAVTKHQVNNLTGEQTGPTHYNLFGNFTPNSISRVQ